MSGSQDVKVLRTALKEAEDELCALGDALVHEGWDTATIARTLDVVRIALYGTDGAGNGVDGFEPARKVLHDLRAAEAAETKQQGKKPAALAHRKVYERKNDDAAGDAGKRGEDNESEARLVLRRGTLAAR